MHRAHGATLHPTGSVPVETSTGTSMVGMRADRRRSAVALDAEVATSEGRGLPVAQLRAPASASATHYVTTTIDVHGRVGDRSSLRIMGWGPGHPVAVALADEAIVVSSRPGSRETVTRQGHLRLPASVRHACRLQPGARLLLAAHPDAGNLFAYTTSVIDQMVLVYSAHHESGSAL